MDTTSFFNYPTLEAQALGAIPSPSGFLADRTEEEWNVVLESMVTLRFRPGETVLEGGVPDRAFYLLRDGRLRVEPGDGPEPEPLRPPTLVGSIAFLDGLPRAVTVTALDHGELLRMGFDAWSALSARHPVLGRAILLDVARAVAAQARSAPLAPGWSG